MVSKLNLSDMVMHKTLNAMQLMYESKMLDCIEELSPKNLYSSSSPHNYFGISCIAKRGKSWNVEG